MSGIGGERHASVMNRILLGLTLVSIWCILAVGDALAQPKPEFKLGFQALAGQIPGVVGEPLESEHHGSNGDSLQRTTTGLMVWRKADNWTAFTNGSRTWINGPSGVQERSNDDRFDWEVPLPASQTPAMVQVPSPSVRFYSPDVKAMDEESAGPGVIVKSLMAEIDAEWTRAWGWRPKRPTTVYLYFDGYRLADGIVWVTGLPMSREERERIANNIAGYRTQDVHTGGWAILMNVSLGFGGRYWETITKSYLLHEYAHVMERDVAGNVGPTWFIEGMAELCAYSKVPEMIGLSERPRLVAQFRRRGALPSLMQLQGNWDGWLRQGEDNPQVAYGAAYLAVKYLADGVGGEPLLQVLEKMAAGQGFESALQAMTGYTVERLNSEYQVLIPVP